MNRTTTIATILLTGLLIVTAGCSDKEASAPMKAVVNLMQAIDKSDKDQFLASIYCEDEKFATAMFDSMIAMADLAKAFEKEYGKDALQGTQTSLTSFPTGDEVREKVTIEEKDGKTFAVMKGVGDPMPLVKKDGKWKVDMTAMAPPKEKQKVMMMAQQKKMGTAARNAGEKVGRDKYKGRPEAIINEMMMEMTGGFDLKKMMENAPNSMTPPGL